MAEEMAVSSGMISRESQGAKDRENRWQRSFTEFKVKAQTKERDCVCEPGGVDAADLVRGHKVFSHIGRQSGNQGIGGMG
ncbi:hypothetical protein ACTXT7_014984 [Hymenolepis weldensis]